MRLVSLFFLLLSFWPWEKEPGTTQKTLLAVPAGTSVVGVIRVALFYEKPSVEIAIPGPYEIQGIPGSQALVQGLALSSTRIRPDARGIWIGPVFHPVSGLRIRSETKEVEVEKRRYHNVIEILKNPSGTLTLVNEIDVEDYLKGVLPWETNPDWPEEALKAQAVASRTYAIFKNIENKNFPFTLGSDVGDQVYRGKSIEKSQTTRAIERTRGEILMVHGKILLAFFHSTCGGRTARAEEQLKAEPVAALRGVDCPFCGGSKHFSWTAEFSDSEIESLLTKKGFRVSAIKEIIPTELDPSGRARFFTVRLEKSSLKIPANEFRLALGPDRMRSTRVRMDRKEKGFLFRGRGWGHGVGMCQFGAKHLAELGYRYTDILRYYYPGSEIRNLEEFKGFVGEEPAKPSEGNIFKRWYGQLKSYVEDL